MLFLVQVIDIEDGSEKDEQREYHHCRTDDTVNDDNAVGGEVASYLIDEPCQAIPPQQCSKHDAQVADAHLKRMVGYHECQLCETTHEEEYNQGIGEGYKECRHPIMDKRPFLLAADMHFLRRVALEAIDAKYQEQDTTAYLQIKEVAPRLYELHHETHAKTSDESIENVAYGGTDTSHETIPTPLVKCALNAKNANRSHRRRC